MMLFRLMLCVLPAAALAGPAFAFQPPAKPAAHSDTPPIFAKKTVAEAREATKDSDKILVAKATASWCGPCKQMDKTTWRDDAVVKWFEANGMAVVFDVDEEKEVAKQFRISAMPTMIAFKKGEEFDRVVGYKSADDLIAWLDGVKRGEKAIDPLLKKADAAKAGGKKLSMQERMNLARELVQAGQAEKAADEYIWLWENMLKEEPSMVGVRGSFMAGDMERLASENDAARTRFAAIRDQAETRLKGEDKTWDDLGDWIVLNQVVGDEDKTLEWFDRIKKDDDAEATIDRFAFRIERLLEEHDRWADMGRLCKDPLARLKRDNRQMKQMLAMLLPPQMKEHEEEFKEMHIRTFRDKAAKLYASLLAAGREEDAAKVAAEAVKLDDTPEMRLDLVQTALLAHQARATQIKLLDEADKAGDAEQSKELRQRIARSLDSKG